MNLKGKVPLFNTTVDATDPGDIAEETGSMVIGVVLALIALAVGSWVFERGNEVAGTNAEAGIPVAGDN